MPAVLTVASNVSCGKAAGGNHGGKVLVISTAKLQVNRKSVLLRDSIESMAVDTVANKCQTPLTDKTSPCATVISVTVGEATKLTVGERPVMVDALVGVTNGVPPGPLAAEANQSKLTTV